MPLTADLGVCSQPTGYWLMMGMFGLQSSSCAAFVHLQCSFS